jgi:twitching motility two-component system response regulator PilG
LLFEPSTPEECLKNLSDYRAICWLVEQQYLELSQAATLIEELAKEVLESFLVLTQGTYEVVEKADIEDYPRLCNLDLRLLVEYCHAQLRRRQATGKPLPPTPTQENSAPSNPTSRLRTTNPREPLELPQNLPNNVNPVEARKRNESDDKTSNKATGHYTIACIDDSPTILHSIKTFLDDSSFSVLLINDPLKALMQVVRNKPDLILLDVGMPNLDGYELCSLLRRHPSFKHTPIIMVTGHTGFIDRAKAKLVGASGYLTKPFTQSDLLKMVFKHLN